MLPLRRISGASPIHLRLAELGRRYAKHLEPEIGFVERLVLFWSNHFSIHHEKSLMVKATVGHFERTVIRKHVLAAFRRCSRPRSRIPP